ncbi:MAG: protein translocase SEC61 complex subunit gamma [Nanoarchaeota archaeon]
MGKLKTFINECKRVFKVTRKPTKQELSVMVKVTGAGILLVGFMGFIIYLVRQLIF